MLHEKALAEPPVAVQILGEEHADDHAHAVVHEAGGQQLADAGIDDGKAGAALAPGSKCSSLPGHGMPRQSGLNSSSNTSG
jgi:hypothetical protein